MIKKEYTLYTDKNTYKNICEGRPICGSFTTFKPTSPSEIYNIKIQTHFEIDDSEEIMQIKKKDLLDLIEYLEGDTNNSKEYLARLIKSED